MRFWIVSALIALVAVAAPAADTPARITGIAAAPAVDGSAVVVTFVVSDARRDLLLFWGTAPMATAEDLLGVAATAYLDAGTLRYVVPVPPDMAWWFAVLDAELYKVGGAPLVPGENATIAGAGADSVVVEAALRRASPLPALQLDRAFDTGRAVDASLPGVPPERAVSPATALAIADLLQEAGPPARPVLKVQVLGPESAAEGGDPVLRAAAVDALARGDWVQAEKRLKDYLSMNRTPQLKARARFYLGQAYWFQDRPRDAFFEFLGCEDALPRESRAWQEVCLARLARD
jgi:hypothetical protein